MGRREALPCQSRCCASFASFGAPSYVSVFFFYYFTGVVHMKLSSNMVSSERAITLWQTRAKKVPALWCVQASCEDRGLAWNLDKGETEAMQ